jgi:hypothetical protein
MPMTKAFCIKRIKEFRRGQATGEETMICQKTVIPACIGIHVFRRTFYEGLGSVARAETNCARARD